MLILGSSKFEQAVQVSNLDAVKNKNFALFPAALDRLIHYRHVLEFNRDSYRFKESLRQSEEAL